MLHGSARGRRRLYRPGDPVHPERKGKTHPEKRDIPERYRSLVNWYLSDYSRRKPNTKLSRARDWLQFVGLIPAYDLEEMKEAIKDCERVDASEW